MCLREDTHLDTDTMPMMTPISYHKETHTNRLTDHTPISVMNGHTHRHNDYTDHYTHVYVYQSECAHNIGDNNNITLQVHIIHLKFYLY